MRKNRFSWFDNVCRRSKHVLERKKDTVRTTTKRKRRSKLVLVFICSLTEKIVLSHVKVKIQDLCKDFV